MSTVVRYIHFLYYNCSDITITIKQKQGPVLINMRGTYHSVIDHNARVQSSDIIRSKA